MKNQLFLYAFLILAISIVGSCKKEDHDRVIEFWTDKDLSTTSYTRLLIDNVTVGTLTQSTSTPACNDISSIQYDLPPHTAIDLNLLNNNNDTLYFGTISLGDFSSGISVVASNTSIGATIDIGGTSNDVCTTIRLDWQ